MKNGVINLAHNIIESFKNTIFGFIQGIFDGFKKLKDDAAQLGVDVSDCIDENENKIKQIASKIFLDTTSCITTKTTKAFEILNVAVQTIKAIINDVNKLQDDFDECKDVGCYMRMGVEASKLLISLPLRATKVFLSAQQTIIMIQLEITACVGEKFLQLKDLVAPAVDAVNQCIAEKIAGVEETTTSTTTTTQSSETEKFLSKYFF